MFIRFVVVAMLAVSLLPSAGSAQTAAELLQKGIYTQQTAGNLDAAIQIFQQVIAMPGVDRAIAARAQMQLVSAFLLKGDFTGAQREFAVLTLNYGDQKDVVTAMAAAIRAFGSMRPAQDSPAPAKLTRGTLDKGVYHNTATGVEIRLPEGWLVMGDPGSLEAGEFVQVRDPGGHSFLVWMMSQSGPAEQLPKDLEFDLNQKIHQRTVDKVPDFKLRPETVFKYHGGSAIGGGVRDALTAVFEFTQNGAPMVEWYTWVRTEKTVVGFRSFGPASSLQAINPEGLAYHTDIP